MWSFEGLHSKMLLEKLNTIRLFQKNTHGKVDKQPCLINFALTTFINLLPRIQLLLIIAIVHASKPLFYTPCSCFLIFILSISNHSAIYKLLQGVLNQQGLVQWLRRTSTENSFKLMSYLVDWILELLDGYYAWLNWVDWCYI